jgi:acyl-coenzyme A thioesterase 13
MIVMSSDIEKNGSLYAKTSEMGDLSHKGELSVEETKEIIREIISDRAAPGDKPRGDFQVLTGDFIDYTDDGELIVKYPVKEWQCNGLGVMQGGVMGYIADATFGPLGHAIFGRAHVATIDTTTNFLRGVNITVPYLIAKTRVLTKGKNIIHMECKLYNPEGKLVMNATTNMMKTGK